ncbi:MAG: hypothetical protein V4689_14005 [Verrucomicrobiota bacterium]
MTPGNSSMPKIAAATAALIEAMRQASLRKEALKLAKAACKSAEKECRKARKESRQAAKHARRAKEKLDKLHRKIKKSKVRLDDKVSQAGGTPPPAADRVPDTA